MSHCQHCRHELNPDSQFCPECGTSVADASRPSTPGPDNIAMSSEGSPGATPPTTPEPVQPWQPQYGGGSPTAAVPPSPSGPGGEHTVPGAPPAAGAHPPPPPGRFAPEGPPEYGPGNGPPAGPPGSIPPGDAATSGEPRFVAVGEQRSGGSGKWVGLGLGMVGLLAIGFLAIRFLLGGSDVGGASSPEAVVEEMVAAINAQDPLALVDLMAPDELDGVDQLVEDGTQYIEELGLDTLLDEESGDDAALDLIVDIEADRVDVSMEGDDAAIVSFEVSGDIEATGDEAMRDALGDDEISFDSRDLDSVPTRSGDLEMIVVRLDGKWYFSPMLTTGHYIVEAAGLPSGEYDEIGGDRDPGADSPVEAIDALVDVINDPDADALAAALGGGEGRVALAFRDAIDDAFAEIDTGEFRYEVSVETDDIGSGRVELEEIELRVVGDFGDDATVTIEDDCLILRDNGEITSDDCLLEALDLPSGNELDTTLWFDTVNEDGGRRVRIVPTITDVLGRFFTVIEDRQTLLFVTDTAQRDDANSVEPGSDIEIDFDGQLYAVNEFEIEAGEVYNVTASEGTEFDLFVDGEFGALERRFGGDFEAEVDGVARVVTYSEIDRDRECGVLGCLPNGEGRATLRIRQAGRQALPFPTRIAGEFGPGDIRIFELEVETQQRVRLDVTGEGIDWRIRDDGGLFVDTDTYDFPAGTFEMIVINTSGDDDTSYEISPTPA